ncbi:hypothetical protein [Helicobacter sp.]|uniref:hypothetical protein n=1 Tax=Helicobacter sp. TaxID=218 RepID=UPI0025BA4C42|nr:hypothetical protein [Helicobacter sp.]MCI5969245.1 hypothetical protein [Helicobacter sp.]MDY2585500.1 hypothetical protein [Helicobacter sp.]
MTSVSNSLYSNPNSTNSTNYKERQESNTQSTSQNNGAIQQKIKEAIFYDMVAIYGDSLTKSKNSMLLKQYLLDNVSLPTEQTFKDSKNILSQEINDILNNAQSKGQDSKEFHALLSFAKTFFEMDKSREDSKQQLLTLLKQGQSREYATSDAFYHKLFTKTKAPSTMTLGEMDAVIARNEKQGFLRDYSSNNEQVASLLEDFFAFADFYNLIPQESKDKISKHLQISQRYLYNQAGELENRLQLENFTISWGGQWHSL